MREKLLELLKRDAWFKGEVKLASGKVSDFYIDVRRVSLTSEGIYYISHSIWDMIKNDTIHAIGGPTLGADPIVGGVCMVAHGKRKYLKGFLMRKTPKEHGRQQLIEGKELLAGERVVVIDDVATSGGSLLKAVEVLQKEKVIVVKAVTVIDREEGAAEKFSKIGVPLQSIFKRSDFF